jgi:hypothetical protein
MDILSVTCAFKSFDMKIFLILNAFFILTVSATDCHKKNNKVAGDDTLPNGIANTLEKGLYKGRLEVKGPCLNYVIKVLDGNIDTTLIQASWTNPSTNKTHYNVAGLASRCNFPSTIKEGDDFFFRFDPKPDLTCAVCMVFYPVPDRKINIKVVDK